MRICHGLAGYTLEVEDRELEWRKPADVVRLHASSQWRVEADDLIVLASDGGTLGPTCSSEAVGHGRDVFFFVRSDLDPKADVPADRLLLDPGGSASAAGSSFQPAGAAEEDDDLPGDPAFEAFRANIAEARGRLAEAQPVAALAAQARTRLEVQQLAVQAVLDNLASQRATCSRSLALFFRKYEKVQEKLEQNLSKVETSMAALAAVALHPAHQGSERESLADAVPRERILRFTAGVQEERARLVQRLERLRQQDAQAQALSEQVAEALRQALASERVPAAARAIEDGLARAESELLPALRSQVPREGAAPSSILEEEKRSAGRLEDLARACRGLGDLLVDLKAAWEQQCLTYLQRLREVSYIQAQVRNVERQAALLEEEINVQRNYSQQLSHLQKMPKAYRRGLCEIARRQEFRARYVAHAEQARSALARMVEEENGRRREFIHRYGCHLPAGLFESLGSLAPPAKVEVPDFDGALPDVDFSSLREAAPTPGVDVGAGSAGAAGPSHRRAGSDGQSSTVAAGGAAGSAGSSGASERHAAPGEQPGPAAAAAATAGSAASSGASERPAGCCSSSGTAAAGMLGGSAASSGGSGLAASQDEPAVGRL
uniref:Autophagy protein ATG17-like domain-containing protein n=1 Tax=Alexandrium monilatum TaxID=311494 RepID=A0A7S4WAN7_9DINO